MIHFNLSLFNNKIEYHKKSRFIYLSSEKVEGVNFYSNLFKIEFKNKYIYSDIYNKIHLNKIIFIRKI